MSQFTGINTGPTPDDDEIDMDAIVELVEAEGIQAYVEQTGGGCATIYAGRTGSPADLIRPEWIAGAGPGWFEGPGFSRGRGVVGDFWIGLNDDGETDPYAPNTNNPAESAALIVAVVRGTKVPPPMQRSNP